MAKHAPLLIKGQPAELLITDLYETHTAYHRRVEDMAREYEEAVNSERTQRNKEVGTKMREIIDAMGQEVPIDAQNSGWYIDFRYYADLGLAFLNKVEPTDPPEFILAGEEPLSDAPPESGERLN